VLGTNDAVATVTAFTRASWAPVDGRSHRAPATRWAGGSCVANEPTLPARSRSGLATTARRSTSMLTP